MPLHRVEDLMVGDQTMMTYLVEELALKGKIQDAKRVCMRNGLLNHVNEGLRKKFTQMKDDMVQAERFYDYFGPLSKGKYLRMPD